MSSENYSGSVGAQEFTLPSDSAVAELGGLTVDELVGLFTSLDEVPDVDEMDGEYDAALLAQQDLCGIYGGPMLGSNPLFQWRAKAFRPVDGGSGRGYNTFIQRDETIVHRYPMLTSVQPSWIDGRPVYQLDYSPFRTICGRLNMLDELRVLLPGVYLAIGRFGLTARNRYRPLPFVLVGTARPYLRDIDD